MKISRLCTRLVVLYLVFTFFLGCKNEPKKPLANGIYPNFQENNDGLVNFLQINDTLFIKAYFSECGEWGGHREIIRLYRNSEDSLIGQLIIDTVYCDNLIGVGDESSLDENPRKIIKDIKKELNKEDEKRINLFIHRILELKLNHEAKSIIKDNEEYLPIYNDSGTYIEIRHSRSELLIDFRNRNRFANTWYGKIRNEIFELEHKR